MLAVSYQFEFDYCYDSNGRLFPRLEFQVSNPADPDKSVDVQMHLDSGAERSLLNGWIGVSLELDILNGNSISYQTGAGTLLTATTHVVRFLHPDLGGFDLDIGFSSIEIPRNLLGRDFFDLAQIGFRERFAKFYVTARP